MMNAARIHTCKHWTYTSKYTTLALALAVIFEQLARVWVEHRKNFSQPKEFNMSSLWVDMFQCMDMSPSPIGCVEFIVRTLVFWDDS